MNALSMPLFIGHLDGIAEALDRCGDTNTVENVLQDLVDGRVVAYGNERGLLIIQLTPDKYMHFWIATGEMDEVIRLSNEMMEWGRREGYTKASLIGRRGWARVLKKEGWVERSVYMEKDI